MEDRGKAYFIFLSHKKPPNKFTQRICLKVNYYSPTFKENAITYLICVVIKYQLEFVSAIKGQTNVITAYVLLVIYTGHETMLEQEKTHPYTHFEISVLDHRDEGNDIIIAKGHGRGELVLSQAELYPWKRRAEGTINHLYHTLFRPLA